VREIDPAALPASAAALFPEDLPNAAIRHALLAGANPGFAVTDDVAAPTWCVVKPAHYEFTFVGGAPSRDELGRAIDALRRRGGAAVVVRDDDPLRRDPPPGSTGEIPRWEFSGRAANADELASRVPDGCVVRRMDADLLERCRWRDEIVETFGAAERAFAESVGFCLLRGDEILSEAYAAFWRPGEAEIGGVTAQTERGRGLQPIVAARLVLACAERGATTVWSCDQENVGSTRVGEKLGYERRRAYRLIDYPALPAATS
jgi:RimJ/RimL family protein N-acetyltransferase